MKGRSDYLAHTYIAETKGQGSTTLEDHKMSGLKSIGLKRSNRGGIFLSAQRPAKQIVRDSLRPFIGPMRSAPVRPGQHVAGRRGQALRPPPIIA